MILLPGIKVIYEGLTAILATLFNLFVATVVKTYETEPMKLEIPIHTHECP
jgi:hypothetical protein